jgi:hypothetical protein
MRRTALVGVLLALMVGLVSAQQPSQSPPAPQAQQAPRIPASPPGQAATQVGGKWVVPKPDDDPRYTDGKWIIIDYGRPILRGRQDIFGAGADYGKGVNSGAPVWRVGANTTTRIRTETPLVFGDKTLAAGSYSVFVDLKPGAWTLIFSNQPYQQKYDPANKTETWGSFNYDSKSDVFRVPMTVKTGADSVEQFTIQFVNMTGSGGVLEMAWEKTIAQVPFKVGS